MNLYELARHLEAYIKSDIATDAHCCVSYGYLAALLALVQNIEYCDQLPKLRVMKMINGEYRVYDTADPCAYDVVRLEDSE